MSKSNSTPRSANVKLTPAQIKCLEGLSGIAPYFYHVGTFRSLEKRGLVVHNLVVGEPAWQITPVGRAALGSAPTPAPRLPMPAPIDTPKGEGIELELSKQGLRRAENYEAGWYALTSCGKVWATDLPAPAASETAQPEPSAAGTTVNDQRIDNVYRDILGLLDGLYAKRIITDAQLEAALSKADDILDILTGKTSAESEVK